MNEAKRMLENARHPDESYEEYRVRRRRTHALLKRLLKGHYFYKHNTQYKKVPYVK